MGRPDTRIRIAIVGDHAVIRTALSRLLETEPDFEVVDEATDSADALRIVRDVRPDVLLLDVTMPGMNGIDALARLGEPTTCVILLTGAIEDADLVRALQLGVRGVVLKMSTAQVLSESIRRVMAGGYALDSQMIGDLARAVSTRAEPAAHPLKLTPREFQIMTAVAKGASNRKVAQALSLSVQTVKHHLTRIFEKTGVSSRVELAIFVIEHRLATPPTPPVEPRDAISKADIRAAVLRAVGKGASH